MSTVVRDAYRLREGVDPFAFAREVRARAEGELRLRLARRYQAWVEKSRTPEQPKTAGYMHASAVMQERLAPGRRTDWGAVMDFMRDWGHEIDDLQHEVSKIRKHRQLAPDVPVTYMHCGDYVRMRYGDNEGEMTRSRYSLNTSLVLFPVGRRVLVRAFCDEASIVGGSLDFLEEHPAVERFDYWDNTDRPDEVGAAVWSARKRAWDAVYRGWPTTEAFMARLEVSIMSFDFFHQLCPSLDLEREAYKKGEGYFAETST